MSRITSIQERPKSGFTLIELLVVIAIIAILAAILFPVFAAAREKAKQVSCASNENQLGLAFLQYVQDYDETFPNGDAPLSWGTNGTSWEPNGWAGDIYPYVKSAGVYQCPDDKSPSPAMSYVMNTNLIGNGTVFTKLAILNAPSSTVLLYENFGDDITGGAINSDVTLTTGTYVSGGWPGNAPSPGNPATTAADAGSRSDDGMRSYTNLDNWGGGTKDAGDLGSCVGGELGWGALNPIACHGTGSNFLAADGHVKFLRPEQVSPGPNALTATSLSQCPGAPDEPGAWGSDSWILGNAAGTTVLQEVTGADPSGTGLSGNGKRFVLTFSPI